MREDREGGREEGLDFILYVCGRYLVAVTYNMVWR